MQTFVATIFLLLFTSACYSTSLIQIVAAESCYGQIANQIGGNHVNVSSILTNPAQDPHFYSANVSVAKAIATSHLIIFNGIGYDAWMKQFLNNRHSNQVVIEIAELIHAKVGDNPHLWFKPVTSLKLANALLVLFSQLDPQNRGDYEKNYQQFKHQYDLLIQHIQAIKNRYPNTTVIATESLANYLTEELGFKMEGLAFQLSIMNEIPPSPKQILAFESVLKMKQARFLIFNNQVSNPLTQRMQHLAQHEMIPLVGVSEILPAQMSYLGWLNSTLTTFENALKT